ncbi:MAG: GTPase [Dehalococcoidia bacterium]|nr:GTPase [Dehalococcoidia bacterium]
MPDAASNKPRHVLIMGAAGRDFHNFNVVFRDDPASRVVAFTATQIPGIANRRYPARLAGPAYPEGIPIEDEARLEELCARERVDEVVFAYSDVRHELVMHAASRALASGADFRLLGPDATMLRARVPVIAVSATRTGCGKSQTARWLSRRLGEHGLRVAAVRHPMPYGDLEAQRVQRFATREDLDAAQCTLEEREEYEPHIAAGTVVFAGVDYAAIFEEAANAADIIVWDGGNNDFPFVRPDLHIVLTDALRPDDAEAYHPGEATLRMADVVVVAKTNAASPRQVAEAEAVARRLNPTATLVRAASPVVLDEADRLRGRRVLVVDDGPTLTHGGMPYGAGYVAAIEAGAQVVDALPYADESIREALAAYPHVQSVLPALGYSPAQLEALRRSIAAAPVDFVVSGTPIDLAALVDVPQPILRARYEYANASIPTLGSIVDATLERLGVWHPRG